MIDVITSVLAGGVLVYTQLNQHVATSDAQKIQRICASKGLTVKEGTKVRTMQILRRTRHEWGTEYAYRIPLGLSFKDYENITNVLQDGLNRKGSPVDLISDLKRLKFNRNILRDIKGVLKERERHRKEIQISYDGVLKIRVYNEPLPNKIPYNDEWIFNRWVVPVGEAREGLIKHDFEQHAHMLVAGTTDYGKSNYLNVILYTLLNNEDSRFFLIDLKGGLEFGRYKDHSQVDSVARNPEEALETLENAQRKMNEVMDHLYETGKRKVQEAGIKERHFIVIDEGADIADHDECVEILKDIARRGRASGFRLIFATQYPTKETVSSQVKRNMTARVCFPLDTEIASRVVLDEGGAEQLPLIQGRAIYKTDRKYTLQTPYLPTEDLDNKVKINIRSRGDKVEPKRTEDRKHTLDIKEV